MDWETESLKDAFLGELPALIQDQLPGLSFEELRLDT